METEPVEGADDQLFFWETARPPRRKAKKKRKNSTHSMEKILSGIDPSISRKVGSEILNEEFQPATWAVAIALGSGNRDLAVAHYARLRLEDLKRYSSYSKSKEDGLEARRRLNFRKAKTPPPRPYSGNLKPVARVNQRNIRLSPVWLGGLWLGVAGMFSSASSYYTKAFQSSLLDVSFAQSICIGAGIVCMVVALHVGFHKSRLGLKYLIPVGAWSSACASLFFGILLLGTPSKLAPPAAKTADAGDVFLKTEIPSEQPKFALAD